MNAEVFLNRFCAFLGLYIKCLKLTLNQGEWDLSKVAEHDKSSKTGKKNKF